MAYATTHGDFGVRSAINPAGRSKALRFTMLGNANDEIENKRLLARWRAAPTHTRTRSYRSGRSKRLKYSAAMKTWRIVIFRYLGCMFAADGRDRRIGMAVTRCGQLRFILGAENINLKTKMQIYKCCGLTLRVWEWGMASQRQMPARP